MSVAADGRRASSTTSAPYRHNIIQNSNIMISNIVFRVAEVSYIKSNLSLLVGADGKSIKRVFNMFDIRKVSYLHFASISCIITRYYHTE